jgi:mono/diheme cytochrome c family protein
VWFRTPSALAAAGALVMVVGIELVLGRGGGQPSDFSLFLGRFHPLVVHLPIGVLMLVGLAEVATFSPRYRPRIDPALGLVLPVLLVVTVTAFALGHLLGKSGGFAAHALTLHRRLELFASLGACISVALWARHAEAETPASRNAYRGALFVTLALLSVGAHFGGTVTHGASYLTEYAPAPIRGLLGEKEKPASSAAPKAAKPKAAEPLVYADVVQPIVEKYCVECHGEKKQKAKLRLDSLEAMAKGGEGGPAFVAGSSATSELVKRIRLPKDDDDRMPPEGKPGPTPEELAVIAFFIDRGASPTLRVRDTLAPANGRKILEAALAERPSVPGAAPATEPAATPEPPASASAAEAAKAPPEKTNSDSTPAPTPTPEKPDATEKTDSPTAKPTKSSDDIAPVAAAAPVTGGGRAVLAERCEKCHGPSKKKGGLRVDSIEALLAGGENGPAVVPGDPGRSELIRRVRLPLTAKEHMPPKKETQLTDAEIQALAALVRGLSPGTAKAERPKPASVAAKDGSSAPVSDGASSHAEGSLEAPGSAAPGGTPASATGSETQASAAAPSDGAKGQAANDEPADDGPPDAALLARVPSRIALYEDAIAPLFSKRCAKCHSGEKPAARLRVNDYAALLEGGLSGPGVVPGKPDDSLVCQRIRLPRTHDDRMPPEDEPPMTNDEVALVVFWVTSGASPDGLQTAKDMPAPAVRAASEFVHAGDEPGALGADAGCAACTIGKSTGSTPWAAMLTGLVLGGSFLRRSSRRGTFRRGGRG